MEKNTLKIRKQPKLTDVKNIRWFEKYPIFIQF